MKVLLVSANTETSLMVPLPLGLNLMAVTLQRAGHAVRLLDLMGQDGNRFLIRDAITQFEPAVIGISVRNIDNQCMANPRFLLDPVRETVASCRSYSKAPVVLGGAGFSIFPEATLRYVDADLGICGEGELAFPALLSALERGDDLSGIAGLCIRGASTPSRYAVRGRLEGLSLPSPDFWTVPKELRGEAWVPFQTRRGCPMECSYCSTPTLEGIRLRKHPTDQVLEALAAHAAAGFRRFYFVDNTFNIPAVYAKELCHAIRSAELGISWHCILYPGFIDQELVRLMAEAGCVEASLGFESGSPDILGNLNKKFSVAEVRTSAELLMGHGIRTMGFLLLGGPGETRETVLESLAFADALHLDALKVTVGIRIYPGTRLEKAARQEGIIAEGDDLLHPRFYLARGLEGWLEQTIDQWVKERPYCTR
ncbi:B12-binding domain-containing radical SAM protein [Geomonas sp. Red276]